MLVECGLVRAMAGDGVEFTFTPSLGRIATLGNPQEIVQIYADQLHFIDFEQNRGKDLAHYLVMLQQRQAKYG